MGRRDGAKKLVHWYMVTTIGRLNSIPRGSCGAVLQRSGCVGCTWSGTLEGNHVILCGSGG